MNIEVFAQIHNEQTLSTEETIEVDTDGGTVRVSNDTTDARFSRVFPEGKAGVSEIYAGVARPQLSSLLTGTNVCLLVGGPADQGETILGGPPGGDFKGLITTILNKFYLKAGSEMEYAEKEGTPTDLSLSVSMMLVREGEVVDLLSGSAAAQPLEMVPEGGLTLKKLTVKIPASAREAKSFLQVGWNFGKESQMQPAKSSVIVRLDLKKKVVNEKASHSRYTIVKLPAGENLTDSTRHSIHTFSRVIDQLARQPTGNRVVNYDEAALTRLLQDELGGNCSTKALLCLSSMSATNLQKKLLGLANQLGRCKTFPLTDSYNLQQLITQHRAHILSLKRQLEKGETGPQQDMLREQIDRLRLRLDQMQGTASSMAEAKGELSTQLLDTEEDKLRASKALIDSHIRNNQLREEMESKKFELTNKVLTLEHDLQLMDMERDKGRKEMEAMRRQLKATEKERQEFGKVKSDYLALVDDHAAEAKKNEVLTMELLNLLNAKMSVTSQEDSLRKSSFVKEEGRIRDMVNQMNIDRSRAPETHARLLSTKQLYSDQAGYKDLYGQLKSQYADNSQKLGDRMGMMKQDMMNARSLARERQREISALNAQLIVMTGETEALKAGNNRLQHKVKTLSEDFRQRLTKYIEDVSGFVDREGRLIDKEEGMAQYVNRMLKDIKKGHRVRETQLSEATQAYKGRADVIAKDYEKLLCHYGDLRAQVEGLGSGAATVELGPPATSLGLSDSDLEPAQRKEITRLQHEVARLKSNQGNTGRGGTSEDGVENWTDVRRQLKELSLTSQKRLEEERTRLLTKNTVLEEQLSEHQDYIDKHLAKYKSEIHHLRSQLGK